MAQIIEYRDRTDHKIIVVLASLIVFGLVMIFSVASSQNNLNLFFKQVIIMVVGFAAMFTIQHISIDRLRPTIILLYLASYVTIFMLKGPESITVTVNGATRWLRFGPIRFQVAEFVKIGVILMLAWWVENYEYRDSDWVKELKFIAGCLAIGAFPAGLLMKISNDLSSAMVIAGITFIVSFLGSRGMMGWIVHILLAAAVVAFVVWYVMKIRDNMPTEAQVIAGEIKFRDGRIAAWLNPEKYAKSIGFQPLHCLYAVANGGWLGKGLGQSWQKAILPESENDVIFAIIIEELGVMGGLVVLFMFSVLITLMCKIAYNIEDNFGRTIIVGVVAHILLQVIVHCCVCTNVIPNTGIGLPFISSGMTASFLQLMEMAMVLSIARLYIFNIRAKNKKKRREKALKNSSRRRSDKREASSTPAAARKSKSTSSPKPVNVNKPTATTTSRNTASRPTSRANSDWASRVRSFDYGPSTSVSDYSRSRSTGTRRRNYASERNNSGYGNTYTTRSSRYDSSYGRESNSQPRVGTYQTRRTSDRNNSSRKNTSSRRNITQFKPRS